MITEKEKSKAKAKIRSGVPLEDISKELGLSVAILEEWQETLNPDEVIEYEMKTFALEKVHQELCDSSVEDTDIDILQKQLEKSAMDIAKAVPLPLLNGDAIHATALKNCAEAISKLYTTIILKNGMTIHAEGPTQEQYSDKALMAFQNAMRD